MAKTKDGRDIEVARNQDARRFEARIDGEVVATAEFLLTPDLIVFTHTQVDRELEGQGVGSVLVSWALDDARADGYEVVPSCPFVRSYIARHEDEYVDLVHHSQGGSAAS